MLPAVHVPWNVGANFPVLNNSLRRGKKLNCFRDFRPLMARLSLVITLLALSTSSALLAQTIQNSRNNATDVTFHKFQPPVQPEAAVAVGATQAQFDALTTQQITALELEKASRTPAQQKIDSNVLYTIRMMAGKAPAPGIVSLNTGVDVDDSNNLMVDITAHVSNALLQQLNDAGVLVQNSNARFNSIRAIVPSAQIETIAAWPDVIFIAPKAQAMTATMHWPGPVRPARPNFALRAEKIRKQLSAALLQARPITNGTGQGAVTSEGDATHRAVDARGTFSVTGAGLKIGVLSNSVNATGGLTTAQASGDIPPSCSVNPAPPCFTLIQDDIGSLEDEGTAMMEIIHDLAPGASLFFATGDVSEADFAQQILNLQSVSHCDIIVDDLEYFDEPAFQDGILAQAVSTVTANGAFYFSSAGNEGNVDSNTAGYFEGNFNDSGSPAFNFPGGTKTGTIHNFGTVASPVNGDIVTSTGNVYNLTWADPQGASGNDYDLFLVSSAGTVKAQSTNLQTGTQNPLEQITPPALVAGDRLVVFKSTAAAPVFFAINTIRGTLTTNTPGQTHGHSAAQGDGIYSVAATPAAGAFGPGSPAGPFPNPFSASNSFELFTSDGPRRIFFNANGTAVTPGNFSSTGGTVRSKPDITAADGVSTTLPSASGLNPFYGTSAAAPHAASVAALIKSAKPAITQTEMRTALTSTAIDIGAAGNDRDSGAGIVMAFEAINSLGVTGTADPIIGTVTAAENPGNGNGAIEAGEGGIVTVQLKNVGLVNATGITTTLTTSTPGVTITLPGTSAYPNLAAGGGAGTNATPFTFTVASNADCALNINFTLTVNYTGGPQRVETFSVQTGLVTLTNNLGTLPAGTLGVTTATGQQTNRLNRNGVVSSCGVQKAFPTTITTAATRTFDSYTFTACRASCVTPVLTSSNAANIFESAYAGGFTPANIATNYAGDAGSSGNPQSFGISAAAGTAYTIVVNDVPGTATGSSYSLQLPACQLNCNVNQVPIAVAQNVTVVAATPGGSANANINNGSSDPDGDAITITQTPAGPYPHGDTTVLLTVTDTKGATAQTSAVVTVVDPGAGGGDSFSFSPALPSVNVTAGQSVTEHFTFTPTPSTATATALTCSGLPAKTTCTFSPSSIPAGSTPVDVTLTITTTATTTAALHQPRGLYAMWMPLTGLGLVGLVLVGTRKKNRARVASLAILLVAFTALALSGCGGGGSHSTPAPTPTPTPIPTPTPTPAPVTTPGTPTGTFVITATATTGSGATHSATFNLVVQ
jgi:hypothetical protein